MNTLDQLVGDIFENEALTISDDTVFGDVPGWDSLKHVELVVGLESRFGLDLNAGEIAQMTSKRAVRELLAGKGHDA